jgi:antitoxin component of MazEF toxin-antitoxin module
MIRKIFKTGHSLAVTLSKKLLEEVGLKIGDNVQLQADKEQIVISKARKNTQLTMPLSSRPRLGMVIGKGKK